MQSSGAFPLCSSRCVGCRQGCSVHVGMGGAVGSAPVRAVQVTRLFVHSNVPYGDGPASVLAVGTALPRVGRRPAWPPYSGLHVWQEVSARQGCSPNDYRKPRSCLHFTAPAAAGGVIPVVQDAFAGQGPGGEARGSQQVHGQGGAPRRWHCGGADAATLLRGAGCYAQQTAASSQSLS